MWTIGLKALSGGSGAKDFVGGEVNAVGGSCVCGSLNKHPAAFDIGADEGRSRFQ